LSEYDALGKLIGVPVKDYFGRELGKVICCSHDGTGEVKRVIVSRSDGNIDEYNRADIEVSSSAVVIKDKLVFSARFLRKEIEVNMRRMQALEELKKSTKMHQRVYLELKSEFEREMSSLTEGKEKLRGLADQRRDEVARKLMALEKVRATIEVQAMSGEIDENVYRLALSEVKSAIDRSTKELDDLERELNFLDVRLEPKPVEFALPGTPEGTAPPQETSSGAIPGFSSDVPMGLAEDISGPLHVRRV